MKNNVCLWILVIIVIILVVWWLSQPTFMRIRPAESMRYKVDDVKKGCCGLDNHPYTYFWTTKQDCDIYKIRTGIDYKWHPTWPKSQCSIKSLMDYGDAKKGCCEFNPGHPVSERYWMTKQECAREANLNRMSYYWNPDIPKSQCHPPTVYDEGAKKGCCETSTGYTIDSPTIYAWTTEYDCYKGGGWTSHYRHWDPTKSKDQCHA